MDYGPFLQIHSLKAEPDLLRRLLVNHDDELEMAAQRLLDVLITSGCRSVVEEQEYIDSDFRISHSRFYHLHFKDTPRRCKRLHFFSVEIEHDDLDLLPESISAKYLGYSVIRPLPAHPLGPTVLHKDVVDRMFSRLHPKEPRHASCTSIHIVNLAGNELQFLGIPWMQQDKLVAACASVAIWTANQHLSNRFPRDFKRYASAQITELATRYHPATGRGMPSDGLTAEQMVLALRTMGYEPLYLEVRSAEQAGLVASQYVRSSIPVITILTFPEGGHAVTLVGHTSTSSPLRAPQAVQVGAHTANFYNASDFYPRYLAQDDSGGPLRFLEFLNWDQAVQEKVIPQSIRERMEDEYPCVVRLDDRMGDRQEFAYLTSLIVPVPMRVTVKGTTAHRTAMEIAKEFWLRDGLGTNDNLVFDTFLRPSNAYKKWWSPFTDRASDISPLIRQHPLPHWIWITEFGASQSLERRGPVLGHIIQDTSGRGTGQLLDDLIGIVSPNQLALALSDGTFMTSARGSAAPISIFGDGESI